MVVAATFADSGLGMAFAADADLLPRASIPCSEGPIVIPTGAARAAPAGPTATARHQRCRPPAPPVSATVLPNRSCA